MKGIAVATMAGCAIQTSAQDPDFHIYLAFGQSNTEGNARPEDIDRKDVPERFKVMACVDYKNPERKKGQWYRADPPLVRENTGLTPMDWFGRTMVANTPENITIGVVPVAIGGANIDHLGKDMKPEMLDGQAEWYKNFFKQYDNYPYARLVECAKEAQKSGVIKGIMMHQGETNNGNPDWPEKVKKIYHDLLSDLNLKAEDVPLLVGETVRTEMGGICGLHNSVIATMPEVIPTAHVVSSEKLPQAGDGLHFTAYGYRVLGCRYAEEMLKLEGVNDIDMPFGGPVETVTKSIASPDGQTVVTISDKNGIATYSVTLGGVPFITDSPLGLKTNIGNYTEGLELTAATPTESIHDNYSLPNIKKSNVDYNANKAVYTFSQYGQPVFDLIMQVSDNNVAFRYKVLPIKGTLACVVESEATGFTMPEGTTTFLCPQMRPMTGFARTAPSYETSYTPDAEPVKPNTNITNRMGGMMIIPRYTFPCLFHNGDNGWTLISETGIAGDYCGSHLAAKDSGLYTIAYPQQGENNGFGSTGAQIALPGLTPWRTITVGKDLAPIVETTIPFDVVEPLYPASKEYDYGKGVWSWIIKMDPSCNFDEQKRYIDFAHDMGYESVLVDALWDTRIGREGIEKLAKYGKEKGVDLYLWYNSNGAWNDAPQGPRGVMNDIVKRKKDMAWMEKIGVRGIKVDFFGGDKQPTMQLYHDILSDANDHGILVIFHGCTLPRGWDRMYPNFAAAEAVLASENLHFSQGSCDAEAFNAAMHPFCRNTVAAMDFGGSALNKYYNATNETGRGSKRMTSDVFALATAVLFQSPVQHFALAPNNLTDAPDWAIEFMKEVPTTWDDTRFVEGYPGRYIVMERKSGDNTYLVGVNAEKEPKTVSVKVPTGMEKSEFTLYADDPKLGSMKKTAKADKKGFVKVTMPTGGAFVIKN